MTVLDDIDVVSQGQGSQRGERGYAMASLLVGLAIMTVLMSVAMPAWRHAVQREREAELIFRGEQYARAIGLWQRRYPGAFPPSIDVLVEQRFLRKKYVDPMAPDGEFQVLYQASVMAAPGQIPGGGVGSARPGEIAPAPSQPPTTFTPVETGQIAGPRGGVVGVVSKSRERSIRIYNGRSAYNEWQFLYTNVSNRPGVPGQGPPGSAVPGMAPGQVPGVGPGGMPGPQPTRPGGAAPPRR